LIIAEDSEIPDLGRDVFTVGQSVAFRYPDQHHHPGANLADDLSVNGH
jgi:hypothetical protein